MCMNNFKINRIFNVPPPVGILTHLINTDLNFTVHAGITDYIKNPYKNTL